MSENKEKRFRRKDFHIMLFPEEMNILEQKAAAAGVTKTDFVRDIILYGNAKSKGGGMSDGRYKNMLRVLNQIDADLDRIAYTLAVKESNFEKEAEELRKEVQMLITLYDDSFLGMEGSHGDTEKP